MTEPLVAVYDVHIFPGQKWRYTPSFPASLDPIVTVSAQGGSSDSDDGTFASVTDGTVTVDIPVDTDLSEYHVTLVAETDDPEQTAYQHIRFVIAQEASR